MVRLKLEDLHSMKGNREKEKGEQRGRGSGRKGSMERERKTEEGGGGKERRGRQALGAVASNIRLIPPPQEHKGLSSRAKSVLRVTSGFVP